MAANQGFFVGVCACCDRPLPRDRTWSEPTCTPSCWLALNPAERQRIVPEGAPCLACEDRLGERQRMGPGGPAQVPPAIAAVNAEHRDWLQAQSTLAAPRLHLELPTAPPRRVTLGPQGASTIRGADRA